MMRDGGGRESAVPAGTTRVRSARPGEHQDLWVADASPGQITACSVPATPEILTLSYVAAGVLGGRGTPRRGDRIAASKSFRLGRRSRNQWVWCSLSPKECHLTEDGIL